MVHADVIRCAGAIVFDGSGRLLLIRRGNEPSRGLWCEPSGRCEPGESTAEACVREAREECGLELRAVCPVGTIRLGDYELEDYECEVVGGTLRAGDDAAEVRWVSRAELAGLPLVPGLVDVLHRWGCLPRC